MKFAVVVPPGGDSFELFESDELCSRGKLRICATREQEPFKLDNRIDYYAHQLANAKEESTLKEADVYKLLSLRGYDYGPAFQSL